MTVLAANSPGADQVREFILRDFHPHYGELADTFPSDPVWARLQEMGTELWLDTGSIAEAREIWTREFTALTTNNTLLNTEVQQGTYDELIPEAARLLRGLGLGGRDLELELAFVLNAVHALKLVEAFDAFVSVEEHTDLADDLDAAVEVARRYHAICPKRFIVKLPFTAAGLLATRRLSFEGIPVNHTLGFSARQNYVISRLARPRFANVFMGRLGSFVADNDLGDGALVGEKTTLASQRLVMELKRTEGTPTRQIGASFRSGEQVRDLVGIDVMTMPPKVARQFLGLGLTAGQLDDRVHARYKPGVRPDVDRRATGLHTLWDLNAEIVRCVRALEDDNLDAMAPGALVDAFAAHECGDFLVPWTAEQVRRSSEEGKIPKLANWREDLASGRIGLDALMNLAGLNAFRADQAKMDAKVRQVAGA